MTLSKIDLLLIAAAVGGALLIEHGNRTRIEAPAPTDAPPVTVVACPANESVPFSPECMAFIQGSTMPEAPGRLTAPPDGALADSPEQPDAGSFQILRH